MAEIILRSATGGIRPDFETELEPVIRQVETPRGAGGVFSRRIIERVERRWRFVWNSAHVGQRTILLEKWNASGRGVLPMSYLLEDGSDAVSLKFVPGSLRIVDLSATESRMTVEAREVFESTVSPDLLGYNVIVFLVDDVSREHLSAYDNATWTGTPIAAPWANQWDPGTFAYPPTPNVTALAANGLLLSRFHTAAMCSPTRASLLTGRGNEKHTLGNALVPQVGDAEHFYRGKSIYELMDDAGSAYQTGHVGKWHVTQLVGSYVDGIAPGLEASLVSLKKPVTYGKVDFFAGNNANQGPYPPGIMDGSDQNDHTAFAWSRYDVRENPRPFTGAASGPFAGQTGLTFDAYYTGDLPGEHNALVYTEQAAIDFIEDAAEDGKPFFLNVWFHAAHCPCAWSDTEDEFGIAYLSAQGRHSYGATSPNNGNIAAQCKAMLESVDTTVGNVMDAMTPEQAARTMVVFMSDNGTAAGLLTPTTGEADLLDDTTQCIPESNYQAQHSKRAPFEGGIGGFCIIHGPAIVNPGDGSTPRVWDGLCGVEDLFPLFCEWTNTPIPIGDYDFSDALRKGVKNTSETGREFYIKCAFQNGHEDDPLGEAQGNDLRWVSIQDADGWKLLWGRAGAEQLPATTPASPETLAGVYPDEPDLSWLWQFYYLPENPLEANAPDLPTHGGDLFWKPNPAWTDAEAHDYEDKTPVRRLTALSANNPTAAAAFVRLYQHLEENDLIPPDMDLPI